MRNFIGRNGFTWFVGVVEDRLDPSMLGRVRVRCFGWHTDDKVEIPTEALPWAMPMNTINSGQTNNIGQSPTGMIEGTWVVGFFLDGDRAQEPVVMGTIATIPSEFADPSKGFYDPNGIYPELIDEPDVNRLTRNDPIYPHDVIDLKNADLTLSVENANGKGTWDEPEYDPTATEYPYNHVRETESGHIVEFDDTKGEERIHEYHKMGTFYEIQKDGTKITRVVGDDYEVVFKDKNVNVKGNCNLTINADCTTYIKGNWDIQVDGDVHEVIKGTLTQEVTGDVTETYSSNQSTAVSSNRTENVGANVTETYGGSQRTKAGGNIDIDASRIDLN